MDQLKIGRFIAQCRKQNGLTQAQLAEKLNITDRAVSKWENGKAMPDSSIMLELCNALQITVNDLLNGERISSEDHKKKVEEQLLEMLRQKDVTDRRLLKIAGCLIVPTTILYLIGWHAVLLSDFSIGWYIAANILLLITFFFALDLSLSLLRCAGYYRCANCNHTYIPTYLSLSFSLSFRFKKAIMRCPKCRKFCTHNWTSSKE